MSRLVARIEQLEDTLATIEMILGRDRAALVQGLRQLAINIDA
jgi:hypothetical protein